jgi:hypothetical protein
MMKRAVAGVCILLTGLLWTVAANAAARAWLDRDSMHLGETITLNVESDDGTASQPDFSVLFTDFNSLGTQSSRQVSMTNGTTSAKTVWAVGLEPKHAGTLTIPAFSIGGTQTAPLSLTVLPAPAGAQGKPGDSLFVEVTADPLSPYVQQQVRYTVKLYFSVDLSDGTLDEPAASGAVVQKLGRDKQYTATVNGSRYHVLERNYALTPEQSGELTMPELTFRGSAIDNSDPGSFFRRGRAVSARSDAIQLNVRAKPANWGDQPWLPATSLSLNDESELPDQIKVGEPLTRTIKLRAQGLGFEQLPELEFKAPEGAEVYPDKPDTRTRDDGIWLYGERTRKFAIVPTRPGTLILPAVEVKWWNTTLDQIETATLPAREISVVGAAANAAPVAPANATPSPSGSDQAPAPTSVVYPSPTRESDLSFWRWTALLFAVLWLTTAALWWRSRRTIAVDRAIRTHAAQAPGRSVFLRACSMGDLVGAERALVSWARSERAGIRNLGELIVALDNPGQREALADLQRMRYAGANSEGLGARLTRAFRDGFSWIKPRSDVAEISALPPLYPVQR